MQNPTESAAVTTRWLRRVARIWSIIVIAITLLVAITHIIFPDTEPGSYPPVENLLPLIMLLSVLGLAIAWRWEGIGGGINVGFFLVELGLYWAIRGKFFPLQFLVILSSAVVPGVLFLICWWRTKSPSPKVPE